MHEKERGENLEVITKGISDIKPYENNPRNNDDAVDAVANSIKEFNWQQPIVVDKDNVIIAGHTRYKAAKKLGMKQVPVVVADNLTDEQVKAYRLADNKTSELTDWDMDLLDDELGSISDIDMSDFGFEDEDISPDLPDDFFTENDSQPADNTDNKEYLTWGNEKVEVTDEDIELLDGKFKEFKDSERGKSFVQFLCND